jgi:hypothetical protein
MRRGFHPSRTLAQPNIEPAIAESLGEHPAVLVA